MKTKEEILGLTFYPHECGGMIECVSMREALEAMQEYADQEVEKIIEIYKFNNTNTN